MKSRGREIYMRTLLNSLVISYLIQVIFLWTCFLFDKITENNFKLTWFRAFYYPLILKPQFLGLKSFYNDFLKEK